MNINNSNISNSVIIDCGFSLKRTGLIKLLGKVLRGVIGLIGIIVLSG